MNPIFILSGISLMLRTKRFYVETAKKLKKIAKYVNNNTLYFCIDDLLPPSKGVSA